VTGMGRAFMVAAAITLVGMFVSSLRGRETKTRATASNPTTTDDDSNHDARTSLPTHTDGPLYNTNATDESAKSSCTHTNHLKRRRQGDGRRFKRRLDASGF
jgi:hypothetical protein